jgi:flagellar protein FlaJ
MLRRVARTEAYGETAVAFRRALNTAALTGSVDEGLRRVARDTPSRNVLAPFLMKFREHASQGPDALANYLRMESRMLGHQQDRARDRAEGFLELLAEMFMVMLVLPALFVIVLTVMSVIAPGLSKPVATPLGTTSVRGLVVYGSAAFIVVVGLGTSSLVDELRPPGQRVRYRRPEGVVGTIATAASNPASAAVVAVALAVAVGTALLAVGYHPVDALLLGYVAYAVPVGAVAVRRARIDDAKDRELKDFVHAVSGHVSLGRPFPDAVERVASEVDLGPLDEDVAALALNISVTTRDPAAEATDVQSAALDRFVERVGTPLAEQTIGLVTGALDGGSDAETVFDTLQTEIGRLYHEKRSLRSNMLVYVAVGWTTALLVVGITVAVSTSVFDGFAQLSAVADSPGLTLDTSAIDLPRQRFRIYVVTQGTMLAAGWFAGMASRGRYEALLHSGTLVLVAHVVFAGAGLI